MGSNLANHVVVPSGGAEATALRGVALSLMDLPKSGLSPRDPRRLAIGIIFVAWLFHAGVLACENGLALYDYSPEE